MRQEAVEMEVQEALVIRPGDKLLVRVAPNVDPLAFDQFRDQLKERFPDNEVTLIAAEQIAAVCGA